MRKGCDGEVEVVENWKKRMVKIAVQKFESYLEVLNITMHQIFDSHKRLPLKSWLSTLKVLGDLTKNLRLLKSLHLTSEFFPT